MLTLFYSVSRTSINASCYTCRHCDLVHVTLHITHHKSHDCLYMYVHCTGCANKK